MSVAYPPRSCSTEGTLSQVGKPKKATAAAKRSRPVQLTIFDYAAAIGVTLLPEGS